VRRTDGISETPDSSKTSQAEFARAAFDPRPLLRHPVLDRFLVAFLGLALGALHAPVSDEGAATGHIELDRAVGNHRPGQRVVHPGTRSMRQRWERSTVQGASS
jgi:hypothetical protein